MNEDGRRREFSSARRLAIAGALVTGVFGVTMAIYSVLAGEETGGGALLAASALAFGLLATNLDRTLRTGPEEQPQQVPTVAQSSGNGIEGPVVGIQSVSNGSNGSQIAAEPITDRDREVLALVAEGFSNKQIGADLGISERTVKNHLTAMMSKLGAADRTHAVVTAARLGYLDL